MRLCSAQLQHVGPFHSRVAIEGFEAGVNVLAATNETGKSTFLKAIARGLFDRHTCKDSEIRSLQPVGTDLSPTIKVAFEAEQSHFRVTKTFLNSPRSLLEEKQAGAWQTIAEGDQADTRIQHLVRSTKPGRGATSAAHWGLMNYLWARQGEVTSWPDWGTDAGQLIRSRLTHVVLDPIVDSLRQSLWSEYSETFTATGQVKKGGPLYSAQQEVRTLEAELESVRSSMRLIEDQARQFKNLSLKQRALQGEVAASSKKAAQAKEQALKLERVEMELTGLRSNYEAAQLALNRVHEQAQSLEKAERERALVEQQLEDTRKLADDWERKRQLAVGQVGRAEGELAARKQRQKALRQALDRHRTLTAVVSVVKETHALDRLLQKTASQREKLLALEQRLEGFASIKPAQVKALETSERKLQDLRLQLDAMGLRVDLNPSIRSSVRVRRGQDEESLELSPDSPAQLRSPRSLDLEIEGWGSLRIRSGSEQVEGLVEEIESCEESIRQELLGLGVESIAEAAKAVSGRKALKDEIKLLKAGLEALMDGYEEFEEIEKRRAKLVKKQSKLVARYDFPDAELERSKAELESEEESLSEKLRQADRAVEDQEAELQQLRESLQAARTAEGKTLGRLAELKSGSQHWTARVAELRREFPDGVESLRSRRQQDFVQAEARFQAKKSELPKDAERLSERNRRAALAAAEVEGEFTQLTRTMDELKGSLEALGGQGLYSQETVLLERLELAKQRERRARDKGWSHRIVHDLIELRKTQATREVLRPLEDRLSGAFADITGEPERRVFLGDDLGIRGIGNSPDALIPFHQLSQGAKEQLLLCLRVAVASELAESEAQVLILDDVLVNTDASRRERIMDLLASLERRVQVVILTCHPDWYRGVGKRLDFCCGS